MTVMQPVKVRLSHSVTGKVDVGASLEGPLKNQRCALRRMQMINLDTPSVSYTLDTLTNSSLCEKETSSKEIFQKLFYTLNCTLCVSVCV